MALPSISDIARLTGDPDLRNAGAKGTPVCKARLAFNESKFNRDTRKWENGATLYVDAELWEDQAERFADQLRKGDDVHVVGELKTDQWEKDGQRQSKTVLKVRRFKAIPRAEKGAGQSSGGFGGQQSSGGFGGAQGGFGGPGHGFGGPGGRATVANWDNSADADEEPPF